MVEVGRVNIRMTSVALVIMPLIPLDVVVFAAVAVAVAVVVVTLAGIVNRVRGSMPLFR